MVKSKILIPSLFILESNSNDNAQKHLIFFVSLTINKTICPKENTNHSATANNNACLRKNEIMKTIEIIFQQTIRKTKKCKNECANKLGDIIIKTI
ncbi:MAG: hypothetical protein J5517_06410 [Eubacterium sp.]|nr:hypothetical protein [Eubacterium sp.]